MNRTQDLLEADALFHCKDEFRQQVAGTLTDNSDAKNVIPARRTENFDKPERRFVRNCPIEVFQIVARYLILNAALAGFCLGQVRREQARDG